MTDEKRETVTLKSGTGVLIVGQQAADDKKVRKWILLASTPEVSALIAVQVPDDATAKYPDADVRAALLSMTVRPSVPIDEQLRLVPIALTDLSGMRPFRVIPNNAVFLTEGPKDLLEATEQPVLVISVAPGGPEQATDRENFARNLFTGLTDFKDVRIIGRDLLRLDNQQTHEIQAEAKDAKTDTPMKLVQWVRFGGGAFIRFVGVARADAWTQAFPKFRAVRDGVKPRV
jgi:mannose/fructose/N-acetylgalactosamine-specific phosphotransferase system component IIB